MRRNTEHTWINESEAAAMLGYKDRRHFRRKVMQGTVIIALRNTNGRKYQYSEEDIKEYQKKTSTVIH